MAFLPQELMNARRAFQEAFPHTTSATRNVGPHSKAPDGWRSPRRSRDHARLFWGVLLLLGLLACWFTVSAAELQIGQATVPPGGLVSVPVICSGASGAVAAQFDVSFNASVVSLAGLFAGDGLAGHVLDQQELTPGHWRALVYSTTNGPIAPGAVLWLSFAVATNASDGLVSLGMTNAIVAQVTGQRVQPLAEISGVLTVWSAGSFLSMTLDPGGQLELQFQGAEGWQYVLEASTNLMEWVALGTNTVTNGTLTLVEPDVHVFEQRFYRARLVP